MLHLPDISDRHYITKTNGIPSPYNDYPHCDDTQARGYWRQGWGRGRVIIRVLSIYSQASSWTRYPWLGPDRADGSGRFALFPPDTTAAFRYPVLYQVQVPVPVSVRCRQVKCCVRNVMYGMCTDPGTAPRVRGACQQHSPAPPRSHRQPLLLGSF